AYGVPIEAEKIHAFAVRLVKALTWEEYKEILPPGTEFSFFWQDPNQILEILPARFFQISRLRAVGDEGVFVYRCARDESDGAIFVWVLGFWGGTVTFLVFADTRGEMRKGNVRL
ncbi:MAG: hypothetical protein HY618_06955, partial [Candidatus Tectomicrobia bacterium]|nr:hypothetical protein [Candidatus Tectomicrobia bacterium]